MNLCKMNLCFTTYIIDFHMAIVPRNWTLDSIYNSCKILQVITDYYKQSKWDKYVF